ncbi:TonB-dependent receptor plug domain-containing protein [Altericroceibacterium endophyticum]|uniref:TonB-dependent receptor n=1 Tax=Altericroceibacterium endophyticum TaxID=1808508 RepID=A0A6I4T5Q6_9SPHN|nr:TonB-dependent receptor [Altericroceibacterium endophyticum]MXO66187.1 TonB-dependent receptor [Altericroceibacterium endophyticum]
MVLRLRSATSITALMAATAVGAPAFAEDAPSQSTGAQTTRATPEIVVTGSLLDSAAESRIAPLTVLTEEDLAQRGSPTIMDLSKQLPASAGVLGDASQFDGRSQFNQGSASINLRGLGPQRTLVLLNGQRIVATGAGNLPLVDVNMIPAQALARVEVLKDGAAATYGSDAIAGVVNFITRRDQDGFRASGDYRYIDGSDGDWTGALSWGGSLGPVQLFLSGGYQQRSELSTTERGFAMRSFEENPQGGFSGGGNPGNFDFNGTDGGLSFTADEGCEGLGGFRSSEGSASDLCFGNYLGFTNLVEPEDRYQFYGDITLPLGARTELRLTGLYGHTSTRLTTSPSYLPTISPSSEAAYGGSGLFVIPSYAPALADYCARFGDDAGCSVDEGGPPSADALAYPVRFRPLLAGGNPLYDHKRGATLSYRNSDLYRLTGELTHDFSSTLHLKAGVTYSEYDRHYQGTDSLVDYLQNALAGFGGANCTYATAASRAGMSADQLAAVAGGDGCVYFNPFSTGSATNAVTGEANPNYAGADNVLGLDLTPGAGLINDAAVVDSFYTVVTRRANTSQWVGDVQLSGESGVMLPGGAVGFALGAQYRRESYVRQYSAENNLAVNPCPGSILNPDATCSSEVGPLGFLGADRDVNVSSDVFALFAELQLPVTERLQAQLSARYEDYGTGIGSTFDPQARIRFEVADGLALRGGVGTTFRGPPPQNTRAGLVKLELIGSGLRAVDVLANRELSPETATTYNAGIDVDQGRFHASIDYYRYEFEGAIEAEPVSGIVFAMFGASGDEHCGDAAYAGLQDRFTFAGGTCNIANVERLTTYAVNSADVTTSGLDFDASYDQPLGAATLQLGVSGTYLINYDVGDVVVEGVQVQSAFDAAGKLNYQTTAYPLPRWKGYGWLQALWGRQSLRLQLNYVDGYEDQRGAAIFGPNNSALGGVSVTAGKDIGSFTTLDATWRTVLETGTSISVALVNLLDQYPPFARLDQNYDPFTASPLGFTAKLGVTQEF